MGARYYVFEMSPERPSVPLLEVTAQPLTLRKAKQLARIGAQHGDHPRTVVTNPALPGFQEPAYYYEPGTGEKVYYRRRR